MVAESVTDDARLDKNAAFLAIPREAELGRSVVGIDAVPAVASSAGAVIRRGAGAGVTPYVDAGGCDVAFILVRKGNAGGACSSSVAPGQDGGVGVGGWHGIGEDGVGEEEGGGEKKLGDREFHGWFQGED